MKISTWKTSNGNVISVITSAGIYYPVGPLGSYRLSASMASAGQTAALEVITLTGESKGVLGISVNGTTSISAISTPGNQAILNSDIGIKVSAISGTLNLLMDDGMGVTIANGCAEASLVEILSATKIPTGIRARPFDVAGCTLEMGADGKWVGTLGSLSEATADALYASGALANLATGATYRDTNGTQYTYGMAGVGWAIVRTPLVSAPGWDEWAFVGDSITAANSGWNGGTLLEENGGRYNPNLSTPSIAGILSGGRLNIARNFGFGGRNTAYILSQISVVTAGRWKNYMLQCGTNDYVATEAPDLTSATAAYNALLDAIIATNPRCFICIAIPSRSTIRTQKWNYICRNACAARGVEFIDPWLSLNDQTTGYLSATNTSDGVHPLVSGKVISAGPLLLAQIQKYLGPYVPRIPLGIMSDPYDPTTTAVQNGYFASAWVSGIPSQYAYSGPALDVVAVSDAVQPAIFTGRVLRIAANDLSAAASLWTNKIFLNAGVEYELSMYMDLILSKNLLYNMRIDYYNVSDAILRSDNVQQWNLQSSAQPSTTELKGVYRARMMPPATATYCKFYWNLLTAGADYSTVQPFDLSLAALEVHPLV